MPTLVVITRPDPAGRELQQSLSAAKLDCLHLPGLVQAALPPTNADRQSVRQADWWVFTSPAAIRYAADWLPWELASQPHTMPRIAVLSAASAELLASCMQQHANQPDVIWPAHGHRSEDLLTHPDLNRVDGQCMIIFNAPGGRELLARQLHARGARIQELAVYQRIPADLPQAKLARLAAWPGSVLTLWTSNTAISNLHRQLPPAHWQKLIQGDHLLLSERQKIVLENDCTGKMYLASAPDNASLRRQIIGICQ